MKYAIDVRGMFRDGRVTTELGTSSLRHAISILTPTRGFPCRSRQWVRFVGLMALNLATLNAKRLRDPSKWAHCLCELSNLRVIVTAVQETHFTRTADFRVLEDDYVVPSAYDSCSSVVVSLLIGRGLNADVNLVLADDGTDCLWLMLPLSFEFRLVAVYAPNIIAERVSLFSAVKAVPRRSETDSVNGWLECDPWSQDRQGREEN